MEKKSYIIWFSQRTGSTLLAKALESTQIAGIPNEWAQSTEIMKIKDAKELLQEMLFHGRTDNGVFGLKFSMYQSSFNAVCKVFREALEIENNMSDMAVINRALPNCKHIFMTRRNKVRLAVSWWKAIQTGEFHLRYGEKPETADLEEAYNFKAIKHLYIEASMREAAIQELFRQENIVPMTVVYEDFISEYEQTVRDIIHYLDIPYEGQITVKSPYYAITADAINEKWVQRFRKEIQKDWQNIAW